MLDVSEDLNSYLRDGIHSVNGWCLPQLWQTLWPLAQVIGPGPVAEIGVFEGKFLIGLAKTFGATAQNKATAYDVFDMQEFNLDGAGVGKIAALQSNFDRLGPGQDSLQCIPADSLNLGPADSHAFLNQHGPAHFFSVDGCHEVIHTINDVEFAMSVMAQAGIIAVDDYTNANWPGVQEAIARMYLMGSYRFVPLAVTTNKLLLCNYSHQQKYLQVVTSSLATHFPQTRVKRVVRFGFETLTIMPDTQSWTDLSRSTSTDP